MGDFKEKIWDQEIVSVAVGSSTPTGPSHIFMKIPRTRKALGKRDKFLFLF